MATHSSVLAWSIPGTGEPGGLPSMGSHRVGHDWSDLAFFSRKLCSFNQGEKTKFQFGTSLRSLWNNSCPLSQSNNKRPQRQFNILRNLHLAQNCLPLATNLFSFVTNLFCIFCIYHFICPFREQSPLSSDLLSFS